MNLPPPVVYKYESFSTQSLLNLKSQQLYFGSPKNFNDPYDCATLCPIADPTIEELKKLAIYFASKQQGSPSQSMESTVCPPEGFRESVISGAKDALESARMKVLRQNGVTCFSECNDNLLMWAHYGGKCEGFCLAFDTSRIPFNKLRKVQYTEKYPEISISKVLIDKDREAVVDALFNSKSRDWSYEREWRIVHDQAGTLVRYDAQTLKAVYFGPKADFTAIEIVCLILQGQNSSVEFYRGKRNESEFRVDFEPFSYTSHIQAKQLGLI